MTGDSGESGESTAPATASTGVPESTTHGGDTEGETDLEVGRLLWIGAHPDDETYVAPILGLRCVEQDWECTLLIATHGESGSCHLPGGCLPDLRTVRAGEAEDAAALFGADLIHWDLGNSASWEPHAGDVEGRLADWAALEGSTEALVARFREAITQADPDMILTMDPRHGCSCHPEHRAVGALVLAAVAELGGAAPETYLVQTQFGGGTISTDVASIEWFDASPHAASINASLYMYMLHNWSQHPSQLGFSLDEMRDYILAMPDTEKRVGLLEVLTAIETDGPLWDGLCPPSTY